MNKTDDEPEGGGEKARRGDLAKAEKIFRARAALGDPAEALRILRHVVPDVPPDPDDEIQPAG